MEPNEEQPMIDTKEFLSKLEDMNDRLQQGAIDRQQTNAQLHKALCSLEVSNEKLRLTTQAQDTVLDQLSRAVHQLTESVRRIEIRFIGDSTLGSTGLSQTVLSHASSIEDHEGRIEKLEAEQKTTARTVVMMVATAGAVGGVVMWVKSSGIIKWLSN